MVIWIETKLMLIVKVYFKYFLNLRNFNVYTILYLLKYDELFFKGQFRSTTRI
jgi:hypothetical protein